jgi:hypothetical protein
VSTSPTSVLASLPPLREIRRRLDAARREVEVLQGLLRLVMQDPRNRRLDGLPRSRGEECRG